MVRRLASNLDRLKAAEHLATVHPAAERLLVEYGPPILPPVPRRNERFRSLVSSIAAQQVSGHAASAIFQRVIDVLDDDFTPQQIIRAGVMPLRSAGMSRSKAESVLDLAAHCIDGRVRLEMMGSMDDDDVIDMLVQVRGIGVWTAQMVLLFDLRRIDVWPTGDLGVRTGFANAFALPELPTPAELRDLGEPFAPYRSVLAWWCWRATGAPDGRRTKRQALTSRRTSDRASEDSEHLT